MAIASDLSQLIGNTPLVELARFAREYGLKARLLAKAECFNAAGSVKDRVARELIEDAERSGRLKPGGTVIEPTSGNTGVGLALVCALRGYRLILTMPESMSVERRALLRALGAQLVLTPAEEGMGGAIAKAEQLLAETAGAILAGQFVNPANPAAHRKTTAPEIWTQTGGEVDCFVAGVGTGGTITGVGGYLKEKKPGVRIVAVEPGRVRCAFGRQARPARADGHRRGVRAEGA